MQHSLPTRLLVWLTILALGAPYAWAGSCCCAQGETATSEVLVEAQVDEAPSVARCGLCCSDKADAASDEGESDQEPGERCPGSCDCTNCFCCGGKPLLARQRTLLPKLSSPPRAAPETLKVLHPVDDADRLLRPPQA